MWTHYLLTFYRAMTRHRLYAALNVLGLAIGIAVFLVLWLDVRFETSFEQWIPNARQIYLVRTNFIGLDQAEPATMGATLDELREDYPQLNGTRTWTLDATVRQGGQATSEAVQAVDPNFFKVFELPVLSGEKASLLDAPDKVVLSQSTAKQYFGAANPIGQTLTLVLFGEPHAYRVSGVVKDRPRNSDLFMDVFVPLTAQMTAKERTWRGWGWVRVSTYLRFDRPEAAQALDREMDGFVDRHASHDVTPAPAHKTLTLRTAPLVSLHLSDPKDEAVVAAIGLVGLLTLILAGVNYVNLATARAGLRAREVALRKVMGASRAALLGQFIGEAMATTLLAAVIGLALCEVVLPLVNAAGGMALKIDYVSPNSILIPLAAITLLVGLGAGFYPALVLSQFQPAPVLAAARNPGGGRAGARLRELLVVAQFAVAIAFTIATGVILGQTSYLRHADLGFKRDGLIVVASFSNPEITSAQRSSLLDAWRSAPGILSATAGGSAAGVQNGATTYKTKRAGTPGLGLDLHYVLTQPDFFRTYGARLLAGRFLDPEHGGDNQPAAALSANAVLNDGAARTMGFRDASDAVGKSIYSDPTTYVVVGVIDDLRFLSPHQPVPPTVYLLDTRSDKNQLAGVRYAGVAPGAAMARLQQVWRRIVPTVPFRARTSEANFERLYQADDEHGRLFTLGSVIAMAIGCVGLYGLASFNTARRVREIGIRKTLGASTRDVLRLLVGQFLRPVLLANLIAWPLAFLAMRSWLSSFDQKIALGPSYFLVATALTLLIAVATVVSQALAVARSEPAKALHHE